MELRTENVVKKYRSRTVVNNVSVSVRQGEIVGLLGPNGAGKTTTFYMIVGVIRPFSGMVFLDDQEITPMPMYRRSQMGVGYLAQEASVFRQMSVENNIMSVLEFRKDLNKAQREEKLESLLDEFRLQKIRKSKGIQLSGGERRRTEIARALANDPKFLLLDEPFAGVDPIAVQDIQDIVAHLKDRNIGILITDHNVHETLSITDRAYLLYEGSVLHAGTPEEMAADPDVREKYLGRDFELRRHVSKKITDTNISAEATDMANHQ
ncbi:MAG: LPS export ABC transporter ATP-binding protein [Bacteroidales bacterium]|nr:LPS export ABC transporter ATP-binding protein [Candidatus Colimorpha onthohippi]